MILRTIFLLFFATTLPFQVFAEEEQPKTVEVAPVELGPIKVIVKLFGKVKAKRESYLYAETSGVIDKINVKEGTFVPKGTALATLKNEDLKKGHELSVAAMELAKGKYARAKTLLASGFTSKKSVEDAKAEFISAEITARKANQDLDKTRLVMPFDGTCGVFKITEGSFVSQGDEIVAVYDPKDLLVDFGLPEDIVAKVQVGQTVDLLSSKGTIVSVQRAIDPDTHLGLARAELQCPTCVIGASVEISLLLDEKQKTLTIPSEAVFIQHKETHVYVVKEGKSELVLVKTGLVGEGRTEILEGLKAGDLVVLRGQTRLYPSSAVKIYKP